MSNTSESLGYKIFVLILSVFIVGVSIANVIYFNRIRKNGCVDVSSGEATAMLWVNGIILVISVFFFFWSLWRLIFTKDKRKQHKTYLTSPTMGYQAIGSYISAPPAPPPPPPPTAVVTSDSRSGNIVGVGESQAIIAEQQYQ